MCRHRRLTEEIAPQFGSGRGQPGGSVGAHPTEVALEETVAVRRLTLRALGACGAAVEADRDLITDSDRRHVGADLYHGSTALVAQDAGRRERPAAPPCCPLRA